MGGACQCDFSLFSRQFIKDFHLNTLVLSVNFLLSSSEFSETGLFQSSDQLPAITESDQSTIAIQIALIAIGAILGGFGLLIVTTVVIRKRRNKSPRSLDTHPAFAKTKYQPEVETYARKVIPKIDITTPRPVTSAVNLLTETKPITRQSLQPPQPQESAVKINVAEVVQDLKNPDPERRIQAIELLGKSNNPSTNQLLIDLLLHDKEGRVRAKAAATLGLSGKMELIPTLKRVSQEDPDWEVRNMAANAVIFLKDLADL